MDSKSLGLKGVQAVGGVGRGYRRSSSTGTSGASQSVQKMVADTTNQGPKSERLHRFYFQGAGFSGANKVKNIG